MDFAWRGLILGTVGGESFVLGVFSASVPVVRKVQWHYTPIALLLLKKARNPCCVKIKELTLKKKIQILILYMCLLLVCSANKRRFTFLFLDIVTLRKLCLEENKYLPNHMLRNSWPSANLRPTWTHFLATVLSCFTLPIYSYLARSLHRCLQNKLMVFSVGDP